MATGPKTPIGLVRSDGRVIDEAGSLLRLSAVPKEMSLYSIAHPIQGAQVELYWRGNVKTTQIDGRSIRHLHDTFRDLGRLPSNADLIEGLIGWRDWLHSYGVKVGSMNRVANGLWRSTSGSHRLPRIDESPAQAYLGGRTHHPRHFYIEEGESWLWDIAGAYAWSASVARYPSEGWERAESWSGHPLAYVYARVVMPPRTLDQPGTILAPTPFAKGELFGIDLEAYKARRPWPALIFILGGELKCALPVVKIEEVLASWEPVGRLRSLTRPSWIDAVNEGRSIGGVGGKIAKRTANALWGALAASGGYKRVDYRTGAYTDQIGNMKPRSIAVAGMVVAAVRARLFLEALSTMPVICAHTDSAIVPAGYRPTGRIDNGLGSWKLSERMFDLQCFGVSTRRYHVEAETRTWTYVNAGERRNADRHFGAKLRRWIDPAIDDPKIGEQGSKHRWR